MALNLYKTSNNITNPISKGGTLVGNAHRFTIKRYRNNNQDGFLIDHPDKIFDFYGFITDECNISFSTSWKDSAAGSVTKKFTDFLNSKAGQVAQGLIGKNYQPYIATDVWTQQKIQGGNPTSISLKFRSYFNSEERQMCSDYNKIISFLFYFCSPNRPSSFIGNVFNNVANLKDGVMETLDTLSTDQIIVNGKVDESLSYNEDDKNNFISKGSKALRRAIILIQDKYEALAKARYNFTFKFELNNKIFINDNVDWIITSWNFQPSTQVIKTINKGFAPLYVDFNITLETNTVLSNTNSVNVFSPRRPLNITQN